MVHLRLKSRALEIDEVLSIAENKITEVNTTGIIAGFKSEFLGDDNLAWYCCNKPFPTTCHTHAR